jgi:1,4-dihydroxy-2-naphthoate octaprenyltransferase
VRRLLAFVALTRPLFLYGGFAGVALGAAVAASSWRRLDLTTYLWAQSLVTAFHLMTHYSNDYFDRESDAAAQRTLWSGGSGVLVDGHLHPRVALFAALVCAALGAVASARFALIGNPTVAWIGVGIFAGAWWYSAPPLRFAARGLGELDATLVVAVLMPCAGYAAFTGSIDGPILAAVVAPFAAMFAMMLCVELPDVECDAVAGKRNLVVARGPERARRWIAVLSCSAVVVATGLAFSLNGGGVVLALLPATVAAIQLIRLATGAPHPASIALWGVALYATTVTGLAIVYATLAVR